MKITTLTINGNTFEIADAAVEPLSERVEQLEQTQNNSVLTVEQTLTEAQQQQVRNNIGAVEQSLYGMVIKGQNTAVSMDVFAGTDETGYNHPFIGFFGNSDQLVRLTHLAEGTTEYDAATVGQLQAAVGDIESALDRILAIQESLTGGAAQ